MAIDWLNDFEMRFGTNGMIAKLREMKFHGKVEINFCDGNPNTAHVGWVVKPYNEVQVSSTLKGGE